MTGTFTGANTHLFSRESGTAGDGSSDRHIPSFSSLVPGSRPRVRPVLFRLSPRNPVSFRLLFGTVVSPLGGIGGTGGTGGMADTSAPGLLALPRMRSEMSVVLDRRRLGERPVPMVAYQAVHRRRQVKEVEAECRREKVVRKRNESRYGWKSEDVSRERALGRRVSESGNSGREGSGSWLRTTSSRPLALHTSWSQATMDIGTGTDGGEKEQDERSRVQRAPRTFWRVRVTGV